MLRSFTIKIYLLLTLIAIWLSHLLQVFVPETGFDALWYHLPIVEAIVKNQGLVYLPELYQSLNPLLADLFFAIGFIFAGDLGTKIVAYLFALLLTFSTYQLARKYLSPNWSWLLIILVSTFQVIAWQSASFYVDVAKAFFEVSALFFLQKFQDTQRRKFLILSALFFSASLASKLFSLFLLPVFAILIFILSDKNKWLNTIMFVAFSLILPLPFYWFAYQHTGNPFISFSLHTQKLSEIGGTGDAFIYLRERLRFLPISIVELTMAKDYIATIFLVFLPLVYLHKKILTHSRIFPLFFFAVSQYCLWWFLPPTSTRYALSGFIVLALIFFITFAVAIKRQSQYFWPIIISIMMAITINFVPRLLVNLRSIKYLTGQQTKAEYLEQFYDGSIDRNIKEWHFRATP